ncbi:M12 family metallopeptidase [Streptomyces indiaensis]|uniref:Peptidase metallopeptidase domain-containing protein n=1 Tax=Streptomyces indiaensis TaxID=284033 RepID=A0ABP6HG58_9ACTN|nr:M12 family metallopeptidase [Streptomyces indiaensis]MCF1644787.1 M12 family metallopeptidase [Streptomyces indiaensis]
MTARYCSLARTPAPAFARGPAAERPSALASGRRKWVNGTVLHYWFFGGDSDASVIPVPGRGMTRRVSWAGTEEQRDVVRAGFREWQDLGIGIVFAEVADRSEAELRIGFQAGDGSWSAVGREALRAGRHERTMNFGWDLTAPGERATALHQIGHALGLLHEHQSPFAGLHWDDEAVYAELAGPPHHWSRERTHYNILRKLGPDEVDAPVWDPQSIMGFPFPSGLILEPEQYRGGLNPPGTLSAADKEAVLRWYPPAHPQGSPALVPFRSVPLGLGPGEQADFRIDPPESRTYTLGTFGDCDAVVVVFEERDGEPRYLVGRDDGGTPHNTMIRARLVKGRRYVVRVRLYSARGCGGTAVMCW